MTTNKKKDWEKEFDKVIKPNFVVLGVEMKGMTEPIKQFISTLLSEQKQELRKEIRKMKVEKASVLNGKLRVSQDKKDTLYNEYSTKLAYNQAIDDILKLL